jgi:hypothetical protein
MNSAFRGKDGVMKIGFNGSERSTLGVEVEL